MMCRDGDSTKGRKEVPDLVWKGLVKWGREGMGELREEEGLCRGMKLLRALSEEEAGDPCHPIGLGLGNLI